MEKFAYASLTCLPPAINILRLPLLFLPATKLHVFAAQLAFAWC
jgi:hypothetical protein